MMAESGQPLIVRLMEHVEVTDTCWNWIGHKINGGYGRISVNHKNKLAHRTSYELLIGKIPDGLVINHICRNRGCINPEHLEPVTQKENVRQGLTGFKTGLKNRAKTQCPKGHKYTPDNLVKTNRRSCRTCHNVNQRARRTKAKANRVKTQV